MKGAVRLNQQKMRGRQQKMCEGCGLKQPHYGLPAERKARWVRGCSKDHARRTVGIVSKEAGQQTSQGD